MPSLNRLLGVPSSFYLFRTYMFILSTSLFFRFVNKQKNAFVISILRKPVNKAIAKFPDYFVRISPHAKYSQLLNMLTSALISLIYHVPFACVHVFLNYLDSHRELPVKTKQSIINMLESMTGNKDGLVNQYLDLLPTQHNEKLNIGAYLEFLTYKKTYQKVIAKNSSCKVLIAQTESLYNSGGVSAKTTGNVIKIRELLEKLTY